MIRTLALLVASLSLAPAASAFVLHLDHALSSHNPVVTLGGSPMSSAAIDVYDVSTAKGVVVVKSLAAQERYVVMLKNPGAVPVALRLDLFEAGGDAALRGTKPVELVVEAGEERQFAMEAWMPMRVAITVP